MSVPHEVSAFADCHEYAFTHHLLHQATYDTVLKPMRRAGHARAATWLSERTHDRTGEFLAVTAEHFERAGDRAQAASYFTRAAKEAAARFANAAALEHVRRALDNLDPDDVEARFAALSLREQVLDVLGDLAGQRACLDEQAALLPPGGDPRREAEIAIGRALLADRSGDFVQAAAFAATAERLAVPQAMWLIAALACGESAYVMMCNGKYEAARDKAQVAHEYARRSGDLQYEGKILAISALIEQAAGAPLRAIEYNGRALEIARSGGKIRQEGLLEVNLCGALLELGDYEPARRRGEAAERIAREIGNRTVEASALIGLAQVALALGDPVDALAKAQRGVEIHRALGDRYNLAEGQLRHGEALVANGRLVEAIEAFADSGTHYDAAGVGGGRLVADVRIAQVALARGDIATAFRLIDPLLATPMAVPLEPHRVRGIVWQVLHATGDARESSWLATAHQELQAQARGLEEAGAQDRFLRIAWHREICEAWQRAQQGKTAECG